MTKDAHAPHASSDAANVEADRLFKACRFDEAVRLLEGFLAANRGALPPAELLRAHLNLAAFERGRGDFARALSIHEGAVALLDVCRRTDPRRCGMFANGLGLTYLELKGEHPEYEDRAIYWFTAAAVYHEEAGEWGMKAQVENNLAYLHAKAGRTGEALHHVALALGSGPDDAVLGQIEDTQAVIRLAAGDAKGARDFARASVERLERVGQLNILVRSEQTLVRAERAYLDELEGRRTREVLDACDWNLTHAARRLGFNSKQALKHHLRRKFPGLEAERVNRSVHS